MNKENQELESLEITRYIINENYKKTEDLIENVEEQNEWILPGKDNNQCLN